MEIFIKSEDGELIQFELGVFDKDILKNKLVHVNLDAYLTDEEVNSVAKELREIFEKYGSEVIVSTHCNVNVILFDKLTTTGRSGIIIRGKDD